MPTPNTNTTPVRGPLSLTDDIIAYEQGELDQDQTVELFQALIDTGLINQLQGHYGRTGYQLVESGLCHLKGAPRE